ncbi:uncharacterized protein KD926_011702 [Aspergillus affinis]|uniref:uncharacterized protein n=1 Tax=Aspergillus affinis TaxID=1070780 RepID=UPI0022FEFF32|nr:uncharacterized protein KD926_011702 [Aspergillus affinis]KAI9044732.1 hypothetical protein KD926_011702 [Aspergillus affinis]
MCTCIAVLILAINIILTITAIWATGLHLVINVFSTVLLGASNYVMQSLGAPSRTDVDQAHAKSQWLDIGIFNFRNFRVMDTRRKILWVPLLISSTPIHMIYNSAIFSSISNLKYGAFMIPNDLSPTEPLTGGDTTSYETFLSYVGVDETVVRAHIFNGSFVNATSADCVSKYTMEFNTKYGTLIFVADRRHFPNTSSLITFGKILCKRGVFYDETGAPHYPTPWFNFRDDTTLGFHDTNSYGRDISILRNYIYVYNPSYDALREYLDNPAHWASSSWADNITFELIGNGTIDLQHEIEPPARNVPTFHCLIGKAEERCQLYFSPLIAIVVICMLLTSRVRRRDLMLTVGDALSSFLTRPDSTTHGRCFLSHAEVARGSRAWSLPAITFGQLKEYTVQ